MPAADETGCESLSLSPTAAAIAAARLVRRSSASFVVLGGCRCLLDL